MVLLRLSESIYKYFDSISSGSMYAADEPTTAHLRQVCTLEAQKPRTHTHAHTHTHTLLRNPTHHSISWKCASRSPDYVCIVWHRWCRSGYPRAMEGRVNQGWSVYLQPPATSFATAPRPSSHRERGGTPPDRAHALKPGVHCEGTCIYVCMHIHM